ncbi:MAG: bis(5'-nucleosyl)-tetraphosphatase (symmetrical) YqeK [Spirochaetota bacterium]
MAILFTTACTSIEIAIDRVRNRVLRELSTKRADHAHRVAVTADAIARGAGVDPLRARLAGWAHDLCREWDGDGMCAYVDPKRYPPTEAERQHPVLCHGPAAATMLEREYAVSERDILEAVRWHSTGNAGIGRLGKVLYAADYLEPGRRYTTEAFRAYALARSLDGMVKAVLEHIRERNLSMSQETAALYEEVRGHVE